MPRSTISKPTSLRARPFCLLAREHVAADEVALVELHDPAEVGLERGGGVVDVVAVERHLRLEAQRVARAEAARLHAGVDELAQDARRVLGRDVDLEAVLAGVAGARDDRRRAVDRAAGRSGST